MRRKLFVLCFGLALALSGSVNAETWSKISWINEVNSSYRDLEPWISADGKTMYFSSDRIGGYNKYNLEIFVSHYVDGHWTTPQVLPQPLNYPGARDGHPSLSLDGRYMYFHSSRPGGYGGTDSEYGLDIWMSENIDGVWQQPVVLGRNINTDTTDKDPYISVDGQTLIYSSGPLGVRDLLVSHKVNGVWQPAVSMGDTLNSPYTDMHPHLSYTGKYFFFAIGGYGTGFTSDVWRSVKINGAWQTPVKLPFPPNTGADDEASIFNDCTNTLYLYSMSGASWDIATSQWLDMPDANPCQQLIIPDGRWRVRVTLLEAGTNLRNDLYIDEPIHQLLINKSLKHVGRVVHTRFISGEKLVFHVHIDGTPLGLGEYDHYSDSKFARVERIDPLRYLVGFEDMPEDLADWDYDDTRLLVELIGVEVNIWESVNYLGEKQLVTNVDRDVPNFMTMPLYEGVGWDAEVDIPDFAVSEDTYGILVEGDPSLYTDLLAEAPFKSDDVILKLEVTDGTTELGQEAQILVTYLDDDDDGVVDGSTNLLETDLKFYRYDSEASSWEELDTAVDDVSNCLITWSNHSGVYVIGHNNVGGDVTPPGDADPPPNDDTGGDVTLPGGLNLPPNDKDDSDDGPVMCATMSNPQDRGSSNASALIVLFLPLFLWTLIRIASRKANDTRI